MICQYCGAYIDNHAEFCPKCGKLTSGNNRYVTEYENRMDGNQVVPEKKGMSIASMVLGIVGIVAWMIPLIGFPVTIAGLILGILGNKKGGKGFALAGMVLCSITLFVTAANSALGAYQGYMGQNNFLNSIFDKVSQEPEVSSEYTKEYQIVTDKELSREDVQEIVHKLQSRADNFTTEAVVLMKQDQNTWSIQITLPNIDDDYIFETITSDTTLEFIARYGSDGAEVIVTNEYIESASAGTTVNVNGGEENVVYLSFDEKGTDLFAAGTQKYVGQPISIVLNGTVIAEPIVSSAITGGEAMISQNTYEEAETLASFLDTGTLGVQLVEK